MKLTRPALYIDSNELWGLGLHHTCMGSDVRFQMRRFAIHSITAVESTWVTLSGGTRCTPSRNVWCIVLSWDWGARGGHGWGRSGWVGQRGVPALSAWRIAAVRVRRHWSKFAVEIREDFCDWHHVCPLHFQGLPYFHVLVWPVWLPGWKALRRSLGSRSHRGGSMEDRATRNRHQTLGSKIIRISKHWHYMFIIERTATKKDSPRFIRGPDPYKDFPNSRPQTSVLTIQCRQCVNYEKYRQFSILDTGKCSNKSQKILQRDDLLLSPTWCPTSPLGSLCLRVSR